MEPIEEDTSASKSIKDGWMMKIENGCMGLKRKRMHAALSEQFDALWQKTFVLELKKNKNAKKPQASYQFSDGGGVIFVFGVVLLM